MTVQFWRAPPGMVTICPMPMLARVVDVIPDIIPPMPFICVAIALNMPVMSLLEVAASVDTKLLNNVCMAVSIVDSVELMVAASGKADGSANICSKFTWALVMEAPIVASAAANCCICEADAPIAIIASE